MSMTVSVRTEYVNAKKYDFQRKHDKRENKRAPHYINKDLSKDNEVIEFVPLNGRELAELNDLQRRKMIDEGKSPLKVKKRITPENGIAYRQVITFGTDAQEYIRKMSPERQKELYLAIADRMSKEMNTKILYLAIHRDEQSPHAHVMYNKYRSDGTNVKLYRDDLKKFQDIAGSVCKEFGLPITRGVSKEERIKNGDPPHVYLHKTVSELHNTLPKSKEDAEKEIQRKKEEIEKLERERMERLRDIEDKERLIRNAEEKLKKLSEDEAAMREKLEKRIETYQKRIDNYESEIAVKDMILKEKQSDLVKLSQQITECNKVYRDKKDILDQVNKLMSENNHLKLERKQIVDFVKHAEKMSRKCKPKGQELIAGVFMTAAERSMCEFLINAVSKVFEDDLVEHVMKTFADR